MEQEPNNIKALKAEIIADFKTFSLEDKLRAYEMLLCLKRKRVPVEPHQRSNLLPQ